MKQNIPQIMNLLEKHFNYKERTTLNRMRKKPNPFKILISCLLSLRARDENTEKVSKKLFAIADTPEQISKLPIKKLEKLRDIRNWENNITYLTTKKELDSMQYLGG